MKLFKFIFTFALTLNTLGCVSHHPYSATSNKIDPATQKMGLACRSWLFHPDLPLGWGRSDIMEAATQAKISQISVIDTQMTSYLIYGQNCTVVYGS